MFNWAKQQLANVAGTQEPEYGPSAIQPVGRNGDEPAYTELTKQDLTWTVLESTSVETQTFYLTCESGHYGFVQVIYSNVAGLRVTCQFNCKIFYPDPKTPALWSSDPLDNHGFDQSKHSFFADGCSIELSEEGDAYTVKSATNENSLVNVKFTRAAPGFVGGKNGTSTFGTDPKNPWGSMRHAFWPRCKLEGTIITKEGELDVKGQGLFIHALQGMKPHHAAARWNFCNFQGPNYSAVLMEFTTPPSYGSTVVRVGGLASDGKLLLANTGGDVKHLESKQDADNEWPEPTSINYHWEGISGDGKEVVADLTGSLGERIDRLDVMAEVPGFIKTIVASAAGTKPYIYQYAPKMTLELKLGDEVKKEEGKILTEATFIS